MSRTTVSPPSHYQLCTSAQYTDLYDKFYGFVVERKMEKKKNIFPRLYLLILTPITIIDCYERIYIQNVYIWDCKIQN